MDAIETPPVGFTASTSGAASATSEASGPRHKLPMEPQTAKNGMTKKLQWSLLEAKIELMREKANLVREQVLTQKESTRGQVLKNRLMELEIEKIEGEKEEVVRNQNVGINPGLREEPPDKRPRRQASRTFPTKLPSTVTTAFIPSTSNVDLSHLRSAIQQAQTSSTRATPATPLQDTRESSIVPENLNSIVESINFYEANVSASTSQPDSNDALFDVSQMVERMQKIEPIDDYNMMDDGEAGTSQDYIDPNSFLQNLMGGSQAMSSPPLSTGSGMQIASMDMDALTWRLTQFEPVLDQSPAGKELIQVLSSGMAPSEKQRINLVRLLAGYLRTVCRDPARGPDVNERKKCVDMLFDAYPVIGLYSNKLRWHNVDNKKGPLGWIDARIKNEKQKRLLIENFSPA